MLHWRVAVPNRLKRISNPQSNLGHPSLDWLSSGLKPAAHSPAAFAVFSLPSFKLAGYPYSRCCWRSPYAWTRF